MKADLVFYQVANFWKFLGRVDFLSWSIDTKQLTEIWLFTFPCYNVFPSL